MHPGYFPVFFWSLLILVSFWGYGEALRRWLNRKEFSDLGWGLTMAWGMAMTICVSGLLMAFQLAKAPVLCAIVLLGFVVAFVFWAKDFSQQSEEKSKKKRGGKRQTVLPGVTTWKIAGLCVLWLLAAVAFASSIAWPHHIDPNDDLICYLMLPEKLLATGTLIEPFSFQRAGTFGGQSILQAMVMIVGAERNGHVPDRGMAMLMIFGMLLHATRGLKGKYAFVAFLLLFAFWFVPVPRISTNGAMTGGAMLLGMLITLGKCRSVESREFLSVLPVALLLGGTCSIRPTFTVVAACMIGAIAITDFYCSWRAKHGLGNTLARYFFLGCITFALLVPFMVVLYQSNGTPIVPPFSGFVSKAYQTYAFNEPTKDWGSVLAFFSSPQSLVMLGILALPVFFPARLSYLPIIVGVLAASIVILHRFSALAFLDLYRYLYPIFIPIGFWMLAVSLQKPEQSSELKNITPLPNVPLATAIAVLLAFLFVNARQGSLEVREQAANLPQQIQEVKPFFDPKLQRAYAHLQSLVPPGEKILTMVDASYWLDYARNPMVSINAVGGSSPPPGIPFGQGPDRLAEYLRNLGIRYVIAVEFNNAVLLYTRRLWNEATRPEWFYSAIWKPRFNDFMDNVDALAARDGGLLATAANARLIDLGPAH